MIFGAILAGGTGSRMRIVDMPKQFLPLGEEQKPIIVHTLEKFLTCNQLDATFIGVHPDWVGYMNDLIKKGFDVDSKAMTVKEASESIYRAIKKKV